MNDSQLTQKFLLDTFMYDPDSGNLFWRKAPRRNLPAGSIAGRLHRDGYIQINMKGVSYQAYRLIWIMINGSIPEGIKIDHEDLIRSNNRIGNLRLATDAQNRANAPKLRNYSSSKFKGVSFHKQTGKWQSQIEYDGDYIFIGHFDDEAEAGEAYEFMAKHLHGEFYNAG